MSYPSNRLQKFGIGTLLTGAALVATCGTCRLVNSIDYSQGERVGVINKVSKKGLFWKTHEGQMALEGIVGGRSVGANLWNFSIDRKTDHDENVDSLVYKLQDALNNQQKIKISYIQSIIPFPTRGSTRYYIQGIETLQPSDSSIK
ncbi:hypothetical protein J4422_03695 [Candidatus Pacearchaeota archaeon]|nr:hypothetical protein [Candidatus Pacearchaeota archaeon]